MKHVSTTLFTPTRNVAYERSVGTLRRILKNLIGDNTIAWPFMIP